MAKIQIGAKQGHEEYQNGAKVWTSGPNSVGGVSVQGVFTYLGQKTIKYITISFIPYNSVHDQVTCTITRLSERGVKCAGPYLPNKKYSFSVDNMWYNHAISSIALSGVSIQFMDGTTEELSGSDIEMVAVGGCYVATAVYGSYDCPQVWTLRRYRDYTLAETWYGRAFIHTYYAISPTLVKWFGDTEWFKKMWKGKLDRMVKKLQEKGVASTPYQDRNW